MTAAPSSRTTRASGAAAARTRSSAPAAAIRSSRTSIDRAGPSLAAIVTTSASVTSTSTIQPSTDAAGAIHEIRTTRPPETGPGPAASWVISNGRGALLGDGIAAIYDQVLPGDVGRARAGQPGNGGGDLAG